jgi:hypothetical protein
MKPGAFSISLNVRDIRRQLKGKGIKIETQADESTSGPAIHFIIDPDGSPILIDQHV